MIAIPSGLILLSSEKTFPIDLVSATFNDRDCCIRSTYVNGSASYDVCAQAVRGSIAINPEGYSMTPVYPNPVMEKEFTLNYSIGLDAITTVTIYNATGDIMAVVKNEFQKSGSYSLPISVDKMTSGAYRIVLSSGVFEESQNLVIVK